MADRWPDHSGTVPPVGANRGTTVAGSAGLVDRQRRLTTVPPGRSHGPQHSCGRCGRAV